MGWHPDCSYLRRMDLFVAFLIMFAAITFLGLGLGWLTKHILENDGRRTF